MFTKLSLKFWACEALLVCDDFRTLYVSFRCAVTYTRMVSGRVIHVDMTHHKEKYECICFGYPSPVQYSNEVIIKSQTFLSYSPPDHRVPKLRNIQ